MAMALPAAFLKTSPATTGLLSPWSFFMKANIQASLKSTIVSSLKLPVQNLMSISLNAEMSVEGSDVMAFLSIS